MAARELAEANEAVERATRERREAEEAEAAALQERQEAEAAAAARLRKQNEEARIESYRAKTEDEKVSCFTPPNKFCAILCVKVLHPPKECVVNTLLLRQAIIREILVSIYTESNPAKVADVDPLLKVRN